MAVQRHEPAVALEDGTSAEAASSLNIFCYAPYTPWAPHNAWELTILQGLRARGCSVTYVACDSLYSDCDMYQPSKKNGKTRPWWYCTACRLRTAQVLSRFHMPYRWLGSWLTSEDRRNGRDWVVSIGPEDYQGAQIKNWRIGEWVRSSVHSHFRLNTLDMGDPGIAEAYKSYLYSGYLACVGLSRAYAEVKPDVQLLFNGRMSSTRVALELGKRAGVRTICEERGNSPGRVRLIENADCLDVGHVERLWGIWKEVPLSPAEIEALDDLLGSRRIGQQMEFKAFSPALGDLEETRRRLDLRPERPTWVLFTSSIDESASYAGFAGAFQNQPDWVEACLDYVGKNPDIQFIIRVHPNVGSRNSLGVNSEDMRYYKELAERIPANVRVVQPHDPISSYSLMLLGDVGLVWHSTAAVEMATLGKRVLRAGSGFLRLADFLVDIPGPEATVKVLNDSRRPLAGSEALSTAIRARRWAYIWYFRQAWRLSLVEQPDWNKARARFKTMKELGAGRSAELDRIVDIFLGQKPAYPQPEDVKANRSLDVEARMTARILGLDDPRRAAR